MGCPCSKFLLLAEMEQQQQQQQTYQQQQQQVHHHQHHPSEASIHLDAVSQCKQRKELVKHARDTRLAFSSAQASYLTALFNVGVALEEFFSQHQSAQQLLLPRKMALQYTPVISNRIIVTSPPSSSSRTILSNAPLEGCNCDGVILLPPPPPPGIHTVEPDMYDLPGEPIFLNNKHQKTFEHGDEEPEEDMVLEIEGDEVKVKETMVTHKAEHLAAPAVHQDVRNSNVSMSELRDENHPEDKLAIVMVPTSAAEIFRAVQEDFHKAAESGAAVARMLKAGSGLNKATELGLLGAPARLKAIASTQDVDIESDALGGDEVHVAWSHAITLERLCAWELKLYEEVKAVDAFNAEFNKKRKQLSKLDTYKEVQDETIEYTRAEIKATEMQMSVAIQAMEATAAAIQKIINQELHFQLVELLEGLTDMWRLMHECHERQRSIVYGLKFPDDNMEPASTSRRSATHKLEIALVAWKDSLKAMLSTEEDYIRSLTGWLSASIPKANSQKQYISRKQARNIHLAIPEIYFLCQEWEKSLEVLPRDQACGSIRNFAELVGRIKWHQTEELKVKKKLEGLSKELTRKSSSVCNMEKKLMEGSRKRDTSGMVLTEKKLSVDCTKKLVEDEEAKLKETSRVSRKFTSSSVPAGLVRLFQGVSDFSSISMEAHRELHIRAKHGIKLV